MTNFIWCVRIQDISQSHSFIAVAEFIEISGHNLESSQTWGFRIKCLHYKPESEFLDVIGTKVLWVSSLLVTVISTNGYYSTRTPPPPPRNKSGLKLVCNVITVLYMETSSLKTLKIMLETSSKFYVKEVGFNFKPLVSLLYVHEFVLWLLTTRIWIIMVTSCISITLFLTQWSQGVHFTWKWVFFSHLTYGCHFLPFHLIEHFW